MKNKLTKRQELEKQNLDWFGSGTGFLSSVEKTPRQFREYLDFSEKGIPIKSKVNFYIEAKRLRGIIIHEQWEDAFCKGEWTGWDEMLRDEKWEKIDANIVEFVAKEIFKGTKREYIMDFYNKMESSLC